jgi:3',5'-cyclic-nucleotide phosphodiesterase
MRVVLLLLLSGCATTANARFDAVVLGTSGGIDESDLTSVLVSKSGRGEWIALDAGTLVAGLRRAVARGAVASASELFAKHLHGVFVSHPHLDHVAGLIIASPAAPKVNVYGLAPTLDALAQHVFGGPLWANFTDEGAGHLDRFHLVRMTPATPEDVPGAELRVEAFELSHAGGVSTAFLVSEAGGDCVLYLGDTGPDEVEKSSRLRELRERVASRKLRAIFIEASFADPHDEKTLFGHLTPKWILRELEGVELRGVTVVVTHVKPSVDGDGGLRALLKQQLAPLEARGARVVLPSQGERLSL